MRIIYFLAFFILSSQIAAVGQDCQVEGVEDWQDVTIKVLDDDELDSLEVRGYHPVGEQFLQTKKKIGKLRHLSKEEVKQIKMAAAKSKSCTVYVDTFYYYDEERLFCVWVKWISNE